MATHVASPTSTHCPSRRGPRWPQTRSRPQPRWKLVIPVSALLTTKSSWLLATQGLQRPDPIDTSTTSQKTRCLQTHPLTRPLTTRTSGVTAIGSGTNGGYVSERLSHPEPHRGSGSSLQPGAHHSRVMPHVYHRDRTSGSRGPRG
jgi:hypothetical protein